METYIAPPGPLKLEQLTGSYIVQSNIFDNYNRHGETMLLDVQPQKNQHGTTSALDMGLMEGTMLLALSSDSLELLRQDMEAKSDDSDSASYSDDDGSSYGGKRKAKDKSHGKSLKRRLGGASVPSPVYLLWGGREKGEGEIQLEGKGSNNSHVGHLDFDPSMATASGELVFEEYFGDKKVT